MDDESTTTTATKRPRFFPTLTATRLQIATYLLGIALFSIAFLVFVNSSISFVVTDIIGQKEGVGDAVGTLGFADECLALVACPLWGLLSDRIGVRTVAVLGYSIVAISLACLVQSTNVFPDLLMGRLGFSLGAAACTTMVTAVLPSMVMPASAVEDEDALSTSYHVARQQEEHGTSNGVARHAASPSINSELTITPASFASNAQPFPGDGKDLLQEGAEEGGSSAGTSQLAGLVGFFTGAGALVALSIFLPLPAHLQQDGFGPSESVQVSFYIVAVVALCVAVCIFVGLRNLPGEEKKSISGLFRAPYDETTTTGPEGHPHITLTPQPSYVLLAKESLKLGVTDPAIGLGYLGGFVARASSVGISLFIPLFVNAYFRAYKLAAALTGIGELAALICAPLFGWAGGRAARSQSEWPLLAATALGVVGYVSFGLLRNPDPFHVGGQWAIISVILVGMSQIGAIVCSLALLGRGVNQATSRTCRPIARDLLQTESTTEEEGAPLLQEVSRSGSPPTFDRARLSGSIAGMYSFAGGAGILILTKVGGLLFDKWHTGAPFFLMAIFNAILLVAIVVIRGGSLLRKHRVAV